MLPAPPRGALAPLVTSPEVPPTSSTGGGEVARAIGARLGAQVESLDMFLTELRDRLEQLDQAIAEDSIARERASSAIACSSASIVSTTSWPGTGGEMAAPGSR